MGYSKTELHEIWHGYKKITLTAEQKKRYDKELASDNWKKYSKVRIEKEQ